MNKIGKILVSVGIILLFVALGIFIYHISMNTIIMNRSNNALNKIEEIIENKDKTEDKTTIDGYDYVGIITIPSININLPVQNSWSYKNLLHSPCIYYGNIIDNNLVICAHGYNSQFGHLLNLNTKDIVIITDLNGNTYNYEVVEKVLIDPMDIEEVIDTDYDLTLFCCYNGSAQRVIIHCNRI